MHVLAVVWSASCAKAPPAAAPELSTLHMVDLVQRADAARLAVIAGHAGSARGHLARLADHGFELQRVDKSLRPFAESLVQAARSGADATDLVALGQAAARVGQACGACHDHSGRGPEFAAADVAAGADVIAHMARHQWGVDSLWEGLVVPRDADWQAGATAFFEVPVDAEHHASIPVEFTSLATRVHDLGTEALAVVDPSSRAEVYGQLIGTCGACHRALAGPPGPPVSSPVE
ncbi:MAG: hypothetical protein AAF602_20425 [Myxococcota bacterium]